mgnify:CR=1 FL=1|tara:strand:+ start:234 stop:743 length:510 start_codon:yes stop_codon:yes gene_type:complete
MSNQKPGFFTGVLRAPYNIATHAVDNIVAPLIYAPLNGVIKDTIRLKTKEPMEFNTPVEVNGMKGSIDHKVDLSRSSIKKSFGIKQRGFGEKMHISADHEMRLGAFEPSAEKQKEIAAETERQRLKEEERKRAVIEFLIRRGELPNVDGIQEPNAGEAIPRFMENKTYG